MSFEVGDIVAFLNSTGTGTVVEIQDGKYRVEDENGFDDWYESRDLVIRKKLEVTDIQKKDRPVYKPAPEKSPVRHQIVADLHFEQLVDYPKNFTSHQKLQIQLNEARNAIERARRGGVKKVILIHGIGAGRLREEIHTMLERMDRLSFYDASYAEFGSGATEVELL